VLRPRVKRHAPTGTHSRVGIREAGVSARSVERASASARPPAFPPNVPIPIEWLVGPVAALALALWVSNALWKAHLAADDREHKRSEVAEARLQEIIDELRAALRKAGPK
jgi:hypothetical protein